MSFRTDEGYKVELAFGCVLYGFCHCYSAFLNAIDDYSWDVVVFACDVIAALDGYSLEPEEDGNEEEDIEDVPWSWHVDIGGEWGDVVDKEAGYAGEYCSCECGIEASA